MKGYLTFLLVFATILVLVALIEINNSYKKADYSKAILIERLYGLEMNAKEVVLELMRQGAREGFDSYNKEKDILNCTHCPDYFCVPTLPPTHPNSCDQVKCLNCYRDEEARQIAQRKAIEKFHELDGFVFDDDFNITIEEPKTEVRTKIDPQTKNKHSLNFLRYLKDVKIKVKSERFNLNSSSNIPVGFMINDFD